MRAERRAFVVVLDACGCGELPDSAEYGDAGANTLAHLAEAVGGLELPELERLGLGNVLPLRGVRPVERPAVHGRLRPLGPGKDSTAGHWELMGVSAPRAPTYPRGFPPEVISAFERATGRRVLCNAPREGLRAIEEFGEEQLRTGGLIVYTSQDSVFQVAAHVDAVPEEQLYEHCRAARRILTGEHAVGPGVARPVAGAPGGVAPPPGPRAAAPRPPPPPHHAP
ncbi:MAG: phosphopentomutase, partial [Thermoleophilaceae bacterium]|nr:phosphopentomutase [Thermoleophilaceae bacterium]